MRLRGTYVGWRRLVPQSVYRNRVVEDQDRGRRLVEDRNRGGEFVRQEGVVSIEKCKIIAARDHCARIASRSRPPIFLSEDFDAAAVTVEESRGRIGRAVIDDDNLELE